MACVCIACMHACRRQGTALPLASHTSSGRVWYVSAIRTLARWTPHALPCTAHALESSAIDHGGIAHQMYGADSVLDAPSRAKRQREKEESPSPEYVLGLYSSVSSSRAQTPSAHSTSSSRFDVLRTHAKLSRLRSDKHPPASSTCQAETGNESTRLELRQCEYADPTTCFVRLNLDGASDSENSAVYLLAGKEPLAVGGAASLRVLFGRVAVLTDVLDSDSGASNIFSAPLGPVLITLCAMSAEQDSSEQGDQRPTLSPLLHDAVCQALGYSATRALVENSNQQLCVLQFTSFPPSHNVLSNLELFMPYLGVPSCGKRNVICEGCWRSVPGSRFSPFVLWDEWPQVSRTIAEHRPSALRILVCGEAGTGKSMAARCLMNECLGSYAAVIYIETDVGQPELTPPGLVSAHMVTDKLFGPPASHHRGPPLRAVYFGEATPRENPSIFAAAVSVVVRAGLSHAAEHGLPVVCNSDGWVSGTGGTLLSHVAAALSPSHVVTTTFARAAAVDGGSVAATADALRSCAAAARGQAMVLTSPLTARNTAFAGSAVRDVCVVAYLAGELVSGRVRSVGLEAVNVAFVSEGVPGTHVLAALNGAWVGLAETGGRADLLEWDVKGMGLVRAVDGEGGGRVFIATPLEDDVLEGCDGIVLGGSITIPAGLFLGLRKLYVGKEEGEEVPYVLEGAIDGSEGMRSRGSLRR